MVSQKEELLEFFCCDSGNPSSIIRHPKFSWEEVTSHGSIGPFSPNRPAWSAPTFESLRFGLLQNKSRLQSAFKVLVFFCRNH